MYAKHWFLIIPAGFVLLFGLSECTWYERVPGWFDRAQPDSPAVEEPAATPTPTPTATATPTPTATPEPTSTPVPEFTRADLEGFLLSLDDIPSGWTAVDVDDHPTEVPGAEDLETTVVSAFFQRSDLGPFLVHLLVLTESESDARTAFNAIEAELEGADILDEITDEVRSWETSPMPFADLGDETVAFRAIGDTGLLPVEAHLVTTRKGRFVSLILHAQVISVDADQTEEFARMAVQRLPD
jgi:hypothetical protein